MYYCNKCGHMGEDGPGHCKPTHYLGHLTACDYDAALVPDGKRLPANAELRGAKPIGEASRSNDVLGADAPERN